MTDENAHGTEAVPPAPVAELSMTPTQALSARFDVAASDSAGQPGPQAGGAAGPSQRTGSESRQGFRIGALSLMIRYADGSELAELGAIHRLPNAPAWFSGIANLRGKLTPVFDLASYIGIEHDPQAKRMLLVLSRGKDAAGVLIDGLPERLRWSDAERTDADAAPKQLAPHLRGAASVGGRLWFDLDTESLLGAIEQSLGAPP